MVLYCLLDRILLEEIVEWNFGKTPTRLTGELASVPLYHSIARSLLCAPATKFRCVRL